MAWDHTLAASLPPGFGGVRFYTWSRPTRSLGRNEPGDPVAGSALVTSRSVDVVRRPTGGRSVLHHRELTYAVVVPDRALGGPREAYGLINRGLAAGIASLGVPALVADQGMVLPPDAGPCFAEPAPGEVVAGGRKLVGSAQVRIGGTLLQHGSILLHDDQGMLDQIVAGEEWETRTVPSSGRPVSLAELLPRAPALPELVEAVTEGLSRELAGNWRPAIGKDSLASQGLPSEPRAELLDRYASPSWTWRR